MTTMADTSACTAVCAVLTFFLCRVTFAFAASPPEVPAGASSAAASAAGSQQQQRSPASVLQALHEQTQRTVEQQARSRPPPSAATAGNGEEHQQMNMIVDVVMQHLLSKDVLYQPMKVRHHSRHQQGSHCCKLAILHQHHPRPAHLLALRCASATASHMLVPWA